MHDLAQTIQQLPATGLLPAVATLVIGLTLWLAGRRVLRTSFAALGLVVGGAVGYLVGEGTTLGVPLWLTTTIGALGAALLATIAYRFVVAATVAAVLAVAVPLVVWTLVDLGVLPVDGPTPASPLPELLEPAEDAVDELAAGLDDVESDLPGMPDGLSEWLEEQVIGTAGDQAKEAATEKAEEAMESAPITEQAKEHLARLGDVAIAFWNTAKDVWERTPEKLRLILAGSALIGALLGFLVTTLAPSWTTSITTALVGAGVVMVSGWILATGFGLPDAVWANPTPAAWLGLWIVLSLLGMAVQWKFRPRVADKAG